jgi:RNA polymerase sigma-70 factor (sigma-E family)
MSLMSMGPNSTPVPPTTSAARSDNKRPDSAAMVTALYRSNALGLVRLAYVLTSDLGLAEDIVQDAFHGLYRRWEHLRDPEKALPYVRSAVLNSCRTYVRRRNPEISIDGPDDGQDLASAEAAVLGEEQRRAVMTALGKLPSRQREVLVLRFYLDMSESQIATQMGIGQSTVRSAQHRALTALGRMLKEVS